MSEDQMTIAQGLKFARHDFLNDLQIILMNLDLGNTEQARNSILATTNKMKQHSMLSSLGLPKTEIWLITFEWLHTSFDKLLTCQIKTPISDVNDDDLVSFFKNIIHKTENVIDPLFEYYAHFDVLSTEEEWCITLSIKGKLPKQSNELNDTETFTIVEQLTENLWTFTFRGR